MAVVAITHVFASTAKGKRGDRQPSTLRHVVGGVLMGRRRVTGPLLSVAFSVTVLCVSASPLSCAPTYSITDVGTLGGGPEAGPTASTMPGRWWARASTAPSCGKPTLCTTSMTSFPRAVAGCCMTRGASMESGQICGTGTNPDGKTHAYLLMRTDVNRDPTTVPEPSLAGLLLIAAVSALVVCRRRRRG